ncbi:phytanoyl-CoA dioxygenase [Aureococcus anophagefferens]|nr:phytanoyl-CoA dioxygenase [Aureococcus anophagefferens]
MDNGRDAGPCLSMFVKSKNTFKLIPLAGTTAAASDEKPAKKRFGFVVAAPGDGAFRYEFYAATAADRDGWVADANAAAAAAPATTSGAAAALAFDDDDDDASVAASDVTDSSFISVSLGLS